MWDLYLRDGHYTEMAFKTGMTLFIYLCFPTGKELMRIKRQFGIFTSIGAGIGSVFGPIGAAVGAGVGLIADIVTTCIIFCRKC